MPEPIDWQRAVASLHAERGRAVTAVGIVKTHGTEAQVAAAALDYGEGKAEADAVISALRVALETGTEDQAPETLDARLQAASAARMRVAETARALVGAEAGSKSAWMDLAADALPHLAAAVAAVWAVARGGAERRRRTVARELDAAAWPAFEAVPPA